MLTVQQDDNTATLKGDGWTSDNAAFALWLNSTFPRVGRDDAALVADLNEHGITVSTDEPIPVKLTPSARAALDAVTPA